MGKIARVDMSTLKVAIEEIPKHYLGLGGKGLTSSILSEEVPPMCDPAGAENKLIFFSGDFGRYCGSQ